MTIHAGIGARHVNEKVVALARHLQAPAAHTNRTAEFIEPEYSFSIGMLGDRAGVDAINAAEVTLCPGTDFVYAQCWADKAAVVRIDTDGPHLRRRVPVHLGLMGRFGGHDRGTAPLLKGKESDRHLKKALKHWQVDREGYADAANEPDPELIHPQSVTRCGASTGCPGLGRVGAAV